MRISLKYIITICLLFLGIQDCIYGQGLIWDWVKTATGPGDETGNCVSVNDQGFVYLTGQITNTAFEDTTVYSNGAYPDSYIALIDTNNFFDNVITFEGTQGDESISIDVDKDGNIYATGYFRGNLIFGSDIYEGSSTGTNIFMIKLDNYGNPVWHKTLGNGAIDCGIVVKTIDAYSYWGIIYNDTITLNDSILEPSVNAYGSAIIRLDSLGNSDIILKLYGDDHVRIYSMDVNEGHNIAISGSFSGNVQFGEFDIYSPSVECFVTLIDSSGQVYWVRTSGGPYSDIDFSVTLDNNDNVYVKGDYYQINDLQDTILYSEGDRDLFVSKYNSFGDFCWAKNIEIWYDATDGYDNNTISCDNEGNVYIAGRFMDTLRINNEEVISNGGYDIFIVKIDSSGNVIWVENAGGNNNEYCASMSMDDGGNIYLCGRFYGASQLGPFAINSLGSADIFVAKLIQNPVQVNTIPESKALKLYPNPAKEELNLSVKTKHDNCMVTITDLSGHILESVILRTGINELKINTNNYRSGNYLCNLIMEDKIIESRQIIIVK